MKKTLKITLITIFLLMLLPTTNALEYNIKLNKSIGGEQDDYGISIQNTTDNSYLILGSTLSYAFGSRDIFLIKIDENTKELWNKTYGGIYSEGGNSIQPANDKGYILSGYKQINQFDQHMWIIKIDENGNQLWNKTYGKIKNRDISNIGSAFEGEINEAYSTIQTNDQGYIILGRTNINGYQDELWIIKINETGEEQWNETYDGKYKYCHSIKQTNDQGYIVTGSKIQNNSNSFLLLKIDENGNQLWNKTYGPTNTGKKTVIKTNDNGFLLAGQYQQFNNIPTGSNAWIIKTDNLGIQIWNETFGNSIVNTVLQIDNDDYLIAGSKNLQQEGWITIIDANGNQKWNTTIKEPDAEYRIIFEAIQINENSFILVGAIKDKDVYNVWLLQIEPEEFKINHEAMYIMLFFAMIVSLLFIAPIAYYWRKKYFSK